MSKGWQAEWDAEGGAGEVVVGVVVTIPDLSYTRGFLPWKSEILKIYVYT